MNPKTEIPQESAFSEDSLTRRLESLRITMTSDEGKKLLAQRLEEAERERAQSKKDRERKRLEAACCPERHIAANILNPELEFGELFSKATAKLETGCIGLLSGNRRIGKTQFGVELIKLVTSKGKSARYIKAARMFAEIRAAFSKANNQTEIEVIDEFIKPSLLVIDEFGKFNGTDWENTMWQLLIDERYDAMKDTILISNQTKDEAIQSMGASAASRLKETGFANECKWRARA